MGSTKIEDCRNGEVDTISKNKEKNERAVINFERLLRFGEENR